MYHRVVDDPHGNDGYEFCVTTKQLDAQMAYLKRKGYTCVNLEDLPGMLRSRDLRLRKSVAITFDDGFQDTYDKAFPILQKYGMTGHVMLVSDRIGQTNIWEADKVEPVPLMTVSQIREMEAAGMRFGSHTRTHRTMRGLPDDELREELVGSKAMLEDLLGHEVSTLAYPYGRSSARAFELAQEAGYSLACGIEQVNNTLFSLSRVDAASVEGAGLKWKYKASGTYFRLRQNGALRSAKRMVSRAVGRK
jgi:peptidoglycan/xylan/chitin deacetylase (PgdA/CDA1 family)